MEQILSIAKQIERTHHGLGLPIAFGDICVLAKTSLMYVGEKAIGKSTSIKSIKGLNILEAWDMPMDTMTLTELVGRIGTVDNGNILWRIKDWSTLSPYHRQVFLTVGSQIISDGEFHHTMGSPDKPIALAIKNTVLTVLIGITPMKFGMMIRENENWESMATDRFIKFCTINPLRAKSLKHTPIYHMSPAFKDDRFINVNYSMPIESNLMITKHVLQGQVSQDRLDIFARDLLVSYATIEGYDKITIRTEMEFKNMFEIYMKVFPDLSYSTDIEQPSKFATGSLRLLIEIARHTEGISLKHLADSFGVYEKENRSERYDEMIMRHAKVLLERNYITKTVNSPVVLAPSRRITDYISQYLEWMK